MPCRITSRDAEISFLMQRGFHPRLGARPPRHAIEKHLRGAPMWPRSLRSGDVISGGAVEQSLWT